MAAKTVCENVVHRFPPLPTIRDIIKIYKLTALKQLSQNFLMDLRLIDKIVRSAGKITDGEVCEVGPGPGGITRSILAKNPSRLILVEKDPRFQPALNLLSESAPGKVTLFLDDVMNLDMSKMFSFDLSKDWYEHPPNIHLIGNLPFSVSTPLIIRWLQAISEKRSAWAYGRTKMTLTFQEEVAQRMVAPIASDKRCRLSVMCQNWCQIHHKFTISGRAFVPQPDVNVGVVHFVPLKNPIIPLDFSLVEKVTRTIFNFRQKYSIKAAARLFPEQLRDELVKEMYERAEIDPKIRPFQLSNEEFGRLCYSYKFICDRDPRLYNYNSRGVKIEREYDWLYSKHETNEEEEVDR